MKQLARRLLPPVLYDALRWCLRAEARQGAREPVRFSGDYANWDDARRDSTGYDAPVILERTRAAMLKVKNGEAAFERDSVLLAKPEPPLPLLAGLLRAAAENDGRLHVLDFGGALGSSYFQCRNFLTPVKELRWSVVEQPAPVITGNQDFASEQLRFYPDIEAALRSDDPDLLLLSGVLSFLPDPTAFLTSVMALRFKYIVVDRTFFHSAPGHRLTVQHVPEWIYPASYPAWFFCETELCALFAGHYELIADFPALDQPVLPETYAYAKGLIYRLRA